MSYLLDYLQTLEDSDDRHDVGTVLAKLFLQLSDAELLGGVDVRVEELDVEVVDNLPRQVADGPGVDGFGVALLMLALATQGSLVGAHGPSCLAFLQIKPLDNHLGHMMPELRWPGVFPPIAIGGYKTN